MEKGNMSSKQLNFFITDKEYEEINNFIRNKNVIVMLNEKISNDNVIEFQTKILNNDISPIYLTDKKFIDEIKIKTTDNGIKYLDGLRSPILEFDLGGFFFNNQNALHRGRLYYEYSFWNEQNILEKKSNDFILWSDSLIKEFKKTFLKRYPQEKTFFYSDSAIKWIEDNNASEAGGGQQWKKEI